MAIGVFNRVLFFQKLVRKNIKFCSVDGCFSNRWGFSGIDVVPKLTCLAHTIHYSGRICMFCTAAIYTGQICAACSNEFIKARYNRVIQLRDRLDRIKAKKSVLQKMRRPVLMW